MRFALLILIASTCTSHATDNSIFVQVHPNNQAGTYTFNDQQPGDVVLQHDSGNIINGNGHTGFASVTADQALGRITANADIQAAPNIQGNGSTVAQSRGDHR